MGQRHSCQCDQKNHNIDIFGQTSLAVAAEKSNCAWGQSCKADVLLQIRPKEPYQRDSQPASCTLQKTNSMGETEPTAIVYVFFGPDSINKTQPKKFGATHRCLLRHWLPRSLGFLNLVCLSIVIFGCLSVAPLDILC